MRDPSGVPCASLLRCSRVAPYAELNLFSFALQQDGMALSANIQLSVCRCGHCSGSASMDAHHSALTDLSTSGMQGRAHIVNNHRKASEQRYAPQLPPIAF